jgi:outer membrane protein assembly factor BamC
MNSSYRILYCLIALLAGCSSSVLEGKKIDYKSESKQVRPLEIPPDLSNPSLSDRYAVPDPGSATYSEYNEGQPARTAGVSSGVLPPQQKAHIERSGTQRWLVVEAPPEKVWPVLKEFWQEMGFIVMSENSQTGIMETDWAENRAKIPQGLVRNVIGKVFDQAYSSPERDKFRARMERGQKAGTTEIYVTHRGMYEMYVNDANMRQTGKTVWQARPPDPELEAEMLRLLQAKFSGDPGTAPTKTAKGETAPVTKSEPRAVVNKVNGAPTLVLKDDFDRAWRRVGLSLDRLGFAVQDRDRSSGLYYVKYLNPQVEVQKPGLLSRLAFWRDDDAPSKAKDYRIVVAEASPGTEVKVLAADGNPEKTDAAARILTVLQEDLK